MGAVAASTGGVAAMAASLAAAASGRNRYTRQARILVLARVPILVLARARILVLALVPILGRRARAQARIHIPVPAGDLTMVPAGAGWLRGLPSV